MSKVSVFDHAWIDLVFEGRNQKYGAYQLRRQDSKTTMIALFSGIGLMVLFAGVPTLINYFSPAGAVAAVPETEGTIITLNDFQPPYEAPKPEPRVPETSTEAAAAPTSPTPTTEFKPIVATSAPVEIHTTTDDLNTAPPAATTTPGDSNGTFTTGPTGNVPGGTGTNTSVTAPATGPEVVEISVDVMPQFPGGIEKFYAEVGGKFRTPDYDGATAKVFVSFVVEKDGTMSNIKVTRDACKCLGPEALRVLNSIKTKWQPGKKKGVAVRTAYNLPITVNLQ